ncbi:hypothetical protein [Streptomyces sp. NPDC057052]|uniref:hypothetical protein n=1 Tax=Streptomyces sp. NPDC057052 TaxID=3346010 RepID=UPI00362F042D
MAAEMAGQGTPVLQVRDVVLDPDASWRVRPAPPLVRFLSPVRSVLELAMRRYDHTSAGPGVQALVLVTGIGEDLRCRAVGQGLDHPWPAGVGDVRAARAKP